MFNIRKTRIKLISEKRKIPKSLIFFSLISQLCFGIDFGFAVLLKKQFRSLVQRSTICISTMYIIVLAIPIRYMYANIWFWYTFLEYTLSVVFLNYSKYNVYNYVKDLSDIYIITRVERKVLQFIYIYNGVVTLIIKMTFIIARCFFEPKNCTQVNYTYFVFYWLPNIGLDMIGIIQIVIFYYLFCCIRNVKETFKHFEVDSNMIAKRYAAVADCFDRLIPLHDNLVNIKDFFNS